MEKPLTLTINETHEEIVKIINNSNLPAYILKKILEDIYKQIEILDNQEIENYKKESEKNEKN